MAFTHRKRLFGLGSAFLTSLLLSYSCSKPVTCAIEGCVPETKIKRHSDSQGAYSDDATPDTVTPKIDTLQNKSDDLTKGVDGNSGAIEAAKKKIKELEDAIAANQDGIDQNSGDINQLEEQVIDARAGIQQRTQRPCWLRKQ